MPEKYLPPCRQKLWKKAKPPYTVGYQLFSYQDIKYDVDGWADASRYHPKRFDLVHLQTNLRIKSGWWDGQKYSGFWITPKDEILYWKKTKVL